MAFRVTFLNIIIDFLSFRKQRVVLNVQISKWTSIEAGVPQGFILGPPIFLIYINYLSGDLSINAKLFADYTSLFSIVRDINPSTTHLNNNLRKINNGPMESEFDRSKQARGVIFSRKLQKISHPSPYFNNNPIE